MIKDIKQTRAVRTLQSAGLSRTPHRLAVLNILQQAQKPLSVGDIRKILAPDVRINKVTVYRIVTVLKKLGIIRDVMTVNGGIFFEMATSDHPVHPHLNCTRCGTVNCLAPLTIAQARKLLANPPDNFSVDHVEIVISGICRECLHTNGIRKQPFKKGQK